MKYASGFGGFGHQVYVDDPGGSFVNSEDHVLALCCTAVTLDLSALSELRSLSGAPILVEADLELGMFDFHRSIGVPDECVLTGLDSPSELEKK